MRMTFVVTVGRGSMDLYSRKLAQHLRVPKFFSDIYQRVAEQFNVPLFSCASLRSLWEDMRFLCALKRLGDAVHFPNHHMGRYALFLGRPYIITVHDLIRYFDLRGRTVLIHRPNLRDRIYLSLDYAGIRRAPAIIAISHTTKRDLVRHLGIPEERIFVVYHGVDHDLFRPVEERPIDEPYILFVGSEHPRKNLFTLLKAFKLLKGMDRRFRHLKLVKVGAAGGGEAPFRERTLKAIAQLGLDGDVVFAGVVPDEELPAYYSGAECLVFPSLYEGFGFPVLEAMASGCPVIVSSAGSLPEVAGDAALVVEPLDARALAEAMHALLTDGSLRRRLVQRGLKRASQFSWEKAARETEAVYQQVEAKAA
jgi:glycosyltransferase involved in cell wall biosynthesis